MGPMIGLLWGILSKNVAHYHDMNHECKNRCVTKSAHISHFQITLSCFLLKTPEYDVNVTILIISYMFALAVALLRRVVVSVQCGKSLVRGEQFV